MKRTLYIFGFFAFLAACSPDGAGGNEASTSGNSMALAFMDNPAIVLNAQGNPIEELKVDAREVADKTMSITRENVGEFIEEAKGYSSCLIVVENHTAVRVLSFEDCATSGSWGACMPLAEGYVRRGGVMTPQGDYLNNIIGIPNGEERTAYLFK